MFASKFLSTQFKQVANHTTSFFNAFKPVFKQTRNLSIHEYQSQHIMREYGVRTPAGSVASTPDEAEKIAEALASQDLIIKAQILAGGRGLGTFDSGLKGGIHNCHSPKEVRYFAEKMLGHKLITKQTGPGGKVVSKVLVARRYYIRREAYFGILLDRQFQGPVMIGSSRGGVEIEKVAAEHPEAIIKEPIDMQKGPTPQQTEKMAQALGFQGEPAKEVQTQMTGLWKIFKERDATLVEVNPLIETNQGEVYCLDAKFNFDDNASFRQKELFEERDLSQMDRRDMEALQHDITYIGLDGNIGCLVNGAGLAMATMDIIKLYGGDPANFLDIGGGASQEQVTAAIKILNNDPKVKVILINIFGGIMRCDIIALGLIQAVKELSLKIPLVVRLEGTNLEAAKRILNDSGLRVMTADDLDDAAQKAVKAAQIIELANQAKLNITFELPL